VAEMIALRQLHGDAKGAAARNDRHLVKRIALGTCMETSAWPAS
jgi:hypothetical protein